MQKRTVVLMLMAAGLGIAPSFAADRVNGERLAARWCASCHVISASQREGSDMVPPFSVIAKMQQFDAHKLAFFLLDPHPKMPDMGLSRSAVEDLAAFIVSSAP